METIGCILSVTVFLILITSQLGFVGFIGGLFLIAGGMFVICVD